MSFFDDMLPIVGGAAGFFLGGGAPGAMIGAGIGGKVASAFGGQPDNPYNALTYVGPKLGQGFTPTDLATMEQARRASTSQAAGVQGAMEQRFASAGGGASRGPAGYALGQMASQGALDRNSMFDLGRAGVATERDAENRKLVNEFNIKHTMLAADYDERAHYADTVNKADLFSNLGALGMYTMNQKNKKNSGGIDDFGNFDASGNPVADAVGDYPSLKRNQGIS